MGNLINYQKGDVIDAFIENDNTYLIHGVNCQGVMNAGIAKQIAKVFPEVKEEYENAVETLERLKIDKTNLLGKMIDVTTNSGVVGNLFTQYTYGTYQKQFNCGAFVSALDKFIMKWEKPNKTINIVMPRIGTGLAGERWVKVEGCLKQFSSRNVNFTVYDLE